MSKYNDMKSCYGDKMFHYIDTMPSYNGCTLSIIIGYQNLVTIYETIKVCYFHFFDVLLASKGSN